MDISLGSMVFNNDLLALYSEKPPEIKRKCVSRYNINYNLFNVLSIYCTYVLGFPFMIPVVYGTNYENKLKYSIIEQLECLLLLKLVLVTR